MAKRSASFYSNRFSHDMPIDVVYEELNNVVADNKPEALEVNAKAMTVDLAAGAVTVEGKTLELADRAKSRLYERIGLGSIVDHLSPDSLEIISKDVNKFLAKKDNRFTLKVRNDQVQAVLTDRYQEIPYDTVLSILQRLEGRPVRAYMNDYSMELQTIYPNWAVNPRDGQPINIGTEVSASDMGFGALNFQLYAYRWICTNGMVMGKSVIASFRTVHVQSLSQALTDTQSEIKRVLDAAQGYYLNQVNNLIEAPFNQKAVVEFLSRQQDIGKRAMAYLADKIIEAKPENNWDVVNVLTEAGHNPDFSATLQRTLERAAGDFMLTAGK